MARNYALVKRHILPNRAEWMRQNVKPGKRVRSLAIASDPNGDNITVEDFCRWWNMLCSSMLDPDAGNYVFSSVPGTADELRIRMQVIEDIIKKRTRQAEMEESEQMQMQQGNAPAGISVQSLSLKQRNAIKSLSLHTQALKLAERCRKNLLPYRALSEADQDARQRAFWGK
ncbi:hypothetical protein K2Y11_21260 [bacterium]|nr:hypothetical protein [bacterium]